MEKDIINKTNAMMGQALIIRPGRVPRIRYIPLNHEAFEEIVGGDIEVQYAHEISAAFIFNRDRNLHKLPLNRANVMQDRRGVCCVRGTFIVVGLDDYGDYAGLTEIQQEFFRKHYYVPAKEIVVDGDRQIILGVPV